MAKNKKLTPFENFIFYFMYGVGILTCSLVFLVMLKFYPTEKNLILITSISMGGLIILWSFIKLTIDIRRFKNGKKKEE